MDRWRRIRRWAAILVLVIVGVGALGALLVERNAKRSRSAARALWSRALAADPAAAGNRDVILAIFVSRQARDHARDIARVVDAARSPFVWPVIVARRDSFARRIREWAPRATVVGDSSLELLRGLTHVRGYPAIAAVRSGGKPLFGWSGLFGRQRLTTMLASADSATLVRSLADDLPMPDSVDLVGMDGRTVAIRIPRGQQGARSQLWTYSVAGCGRCEQMLPALRHFLEDTELDWYHVAYRGHLSDGGWPYGGRGPLAVLTDPRGSAADFLRVRGAPGFVLVGPSGQIAASAVGSDAWRSLATVLANLPRSSTGTSRRASSLPGLEPAAGEKSVLADQGSGRSTQEVVR